MCFLFQIWQIFEINKNNWTALVQLQIGKFKAKEEEILMRSLFNLCYSLGLQLTIILIID